MKRTARLRTLAIVLYVVSAVGVLVGAATARVISSGEREIADSTAALRAGDPHGATVHARRAAGWYAPGAPHVRVAYDRLIALATKAETVGDRETALLAWRGVRTAAIETKWIVTPHGEDLARANEAIARLEGTSPRPPGTRTDPPGEIARVELEALSRDESPRTAWVITLVAGAIAWASGAILAARRGLSASGHFDRARAAPWFALTAAGVAAWLLAIWRA